MLTLIKKEFQDMAFLIAIIMAVMILWQMLYLLIISGNKIANLILINVSSVFFILGSSIILGISQAAKDISGKHSAFLLSQPVTRRQLFLARLIIGFGTIALTCLICFSLASIFISGIKHHDNYFELDMQLAFRWYLFVLLGSMVCYGHGLSMAVFSDKDFRIAFVIIAAIYLTMLPVYLVYLTGMGIFSASVLLIWSIAILYFGYQSFLTKPIA